MESRLEVPSSYPEVFPIFPSQTHIRIPASTVNDNTNNKIEIPFGVLVTPFLPFTNQSHILQSNPRLNFPASVIARCQKCFAYINPFCVANNARWTCSLCSERNSFSRNMVSPKVKYNMQLTSVYINVYFIKTRYRQTDLRMLPEVQQFVICT